MDDPHAQPVHEDPIDLELEILEVLREDTQTAELLAETLSQWGEQVGVDAVLWCLEELASHGLVRHSGEALHHAD
jgi:repressor of nif and glnA expression